MPLLQTPEFVQALRLWQEGQFWEVHEALEPLWKRLRGPQRELVQGVILLAAALHQARLNPKGGWRNFHKALRHLEGLPERFEGVRLEHLIGEVRRALENPQQPPGFPLG